MRHHPNEDGKKQHSFYYSFITTAATSKSADELLTVHVFEHEPAPGLRALLRGSVFVLASYKWS
jgi:hypothetical protein